MVDKNTVPWDWELLTSVMTDEVFYEQEHIENNLVAMVKNICSPITSQTF